MHAYSSRMCCCNSLMILQDVLCLSQEQLEDLMYLRKVYTVRCHELDLQRSTLVEQMQDSRMQSVASLNAMAQDTQKLKQVAAATIHTKYKFAWAMFLGVGV